MNFIGFVDMLGTRSVAEYDHEKYTLHVRYFQERVICAAEESFGKHGKVYMFSDGAYFQANDLPMAILFYEKLRLQLLASSDGIFFQGSLTTGTLGGNVKNKNDSTNVTAMSFSSADTVKAYVMQDNFKGIGIFVDPKLLGSRQQKFRDKFVKSIFKPYAEKDDFICFDDIKYPENKEQSFIMLEKALEKYAKTHLVHVPASRYYISMVKSIIGGYKKCDIFDAYDNDNDVYRFSESIKLIFGIDTAEYHQHEIYRFAHYIALNQIVTIVYEYDTADLTSVLKAFTKISKIEYDFKNFSTIPEHFISRRNKELLANYFIHSGKI